MLFQKSSLAKIQNHIQENHDCEICSSLVQDFLERTYLLHYFPQTTLVVGDYGNLVVNNLSKYHNVLQKVSSYQQVLEKSKLPFDNNSFNLIASFMILQWVINPLELLKEMFRVIKNSGGIQLCFIGENSLKELRDALLISEIDTMQGVSARVLPMITIQQIADMLKLAGFIEIVVDKTTINLNYNNFEGIRRDLKTHGSLNIMNNLGVSKEFLATLDSYYTHKHTVDNKLSATLDVVYAVGWKPD